MTDYAWKETQRDGFTELVLDCPLRIGEHRPVILWSIAAGRAYANSISGYSRTFDNLTDAKAYAGNVDGQRFVRGRRS